VPPPDRSLKRGAAKFTTKWLVNPFVRRFAGRGIMPTHALLQTTGRKSGAPRRVPVGNGLRGDTFWIVSEHGRHSDYVRNIEADPRVRVKVRGKWRTGTAYVLPDDDVAARMRALKRPVNDRTVRLMGSELLTIRIDLDPE
jgi:deazaflavin-dependent oxidoreductase (nitroreductase family)